RIAPTARLWHARGPRVKGERGGEQREADDRSRARPPRQVRLGGEHDGGRASGDRDAGERDVDRERRGGARLAGDGGGRVERVDVGRGDDEHARRGELGRD